MILGEALRVLLRRWLIVLLGVLLTLGAAGYIYMSSPPNYIASARMLLLLPPNARGPDVIGSPFLYLPSGLEVIAGLVAVVPSSRAFQEARAEEGLTSAVQVSVDPRSPMLIVQVEGSDPDDVLASRDWVVETLQAELLDLQVEEGAPEAQTAHARVFAAEDMPRSLGNTGTRTVLAVVAAGGVLTLLVAFGVDHLSARRRSRHSAERAAVPDGDSTSAIF